MTRTVVIGLDGAAWHILEPLLDAGTMPRLASLRERGASGILKSTVPAFTPCAWTSALTGVNPGRHGVYGFYEGNLQASAQELVHPGKFRAPTLWEVANNQGATVGVFNVPLTYPPRPLDGWMVSGMMTPIRDGVPHGFASSREVEDQILEACPGYVPDLEGNWEEDWRDDSFAKRALRTLDHRKRAIKRLLEMDQADIVFAVLETPDRLQHVYYRYMDPTDELYHSPEGTQIRQVIIKVFERIDEIVGLLEDYSDGGGVIVCSDHGFTRWELTLRMNALLAEWGYLTFTASGRAMRAGPLKAAFRLAARVVPRRLLRRVKEQSQRSAIDWSRTRAFASPRTVEMLYANVAGREPHGIVNPADLAGLKDELVARLEALTDSRGRSLNGKVWRSEEVYWGDAAAKAPDLLPVFRDNRVWIDAGLFPSDLLTDSSHLPRGLHHPDGILVIAGDGVRRGRRLRSSLLDVMPTALYLAGLRVPEGLDGQVVVDAFAPETLERRPIETTSTQVESGGESDVSPFSEEEQAEIERALKGLGYL